MAKSLKPSDLTISADTGELWNQVCTCECFGNDLQDFLKAVEYGDRNYTSIDAYVQIRKATELFGPMGRGWGVRDIKLIAHGVTKSTKRGTVEGTQMLAHGKFWYIYKGECGEFEIMEDIFLDASGDSMKKVLTGMITKALSYLGWNYDVFRGRFNDVKSFEPVATDDDKALLESLLKRIKPDAAAKIKAYHDERGYLRSDVMADIQKIENALKAKELKEAEAKEVKENAGAAEPADQPG